MSSAGQPSVPAPAAPLMPAPRRLLVRGVNWLGDAVMTTPALQRLREALPQTRIVLASPAGLAALWDHHPAVDEVVPLEQRCTLWGASRQLQAAACELALVLPNSLRSALEVFLARIPRRVGYARPGRTWLLTQPVPPRPEEVRMRKRSPREIRRLIASPAPPPPSAPLPVGAHQVYLYLGLAAAIGASPEPTAPRLQVTDAESQAFSSELLSGRSPGPEGRPLWFGLNVGAKYGPAKRWPLDRFISAAIELHGQTGCGWLVFGGAEDRPLAGEAVTALRAAGVPHVIDLAGRTTLRQLCAGLKFCRVLLTNDSGPMHVAAALGTPVVVPFGSTTPELTAPGLPGDPANRLLRSDAPCSPCFLRQCPIDLRCLKGISVDAVVRSARKAAKAF